MATRPVLSGIERAFEETVACQEPEYLYHYTTFDALEKIISSRILRATHRSFLNDKEDLTSGLHMCRQAVQKWKDEHKGEKRGIAKETLKQLDERKAEKPLSSLSYAASFTEEGDGAAQWQVYGRYGRGVAICFDFNLLRKSLRDAKCSDNTGTIVAPHFFLHRIEYDEEIQQKQVEGLLDAAVRDWPAAKAFYDQQPEERVARFLCHYLDQLAFQTFKHRGHMCEREWRAIPNISGEELVEFHTTRENMRPFLPMKFDPRCIRRILIGSAVRQPFEDLKQVLTLFLEKNGLKVLGRSDRQRSELGKLLGVPAPNKNLKESFPDPPNAIEIQQSAIQLSPPED